MVEKRFGEKYTKKSGSTRRAGRSAAAAGLSHDDTLQNNTGKHTDTMKQAAKSILESVGYISTCYDEYPATAVDEMGSGERRTIECTSGLQQGGRMGPLLF